MGKEKNIPVLRFSEFETGNKHSYRKHLFRDIFIFSIGKSIKQDEASPEFETPCVRYGELYHLYNEVIHEVINRTNIERHELLFSQGDEILLPSAGEDPLDIGAASALTVKNVAIGRTINILRPIKTNMYSQIYVSYYINQRLRKKISTLAKGVSISNVYNSDLKTLEIILPTLPEQQKIASFFTAIDQKISHLKQKHKLLEQYKKGVMQKIFNQQIRFKGDDGREFPKWENKRLGELSEKVNDRNKNGKVTEVFTNSAFSGIVNQREYFDKDIANQDNLFNYIIVEKDDFIYNPRISNHAPVGPIKRNKIGKGVMSPLYSVFRFRDGNLIFLEFFFETTKWHQYMKSIANYGARADRMNITTSDFYLMPLPFPSLEEQTKIANFLSAIDDKIQYTQKQIDQTEQWKKGLMQRMFV